MTRKILQSGLVAVLFALHPLHLESVAWFAERKDVLTTFFWMLTMFSYARYAAYPGIKRYLPVVGFFILGVPELLHKWRHKEKLLGLTAISVFIALSITSWMQNIRKTALYFLNVRSG